MLTDEQNWTRCKNNAVRGKQRKNNGFLLASTWTCWVSSSDSGGSLFLFSLSVSEPSYLLPCIFLSTQQLYFRGIAPPARFTVSPHPKSIVCSTFRRYAAIDRTMFGCLVSLPAVRSSDSSSTLSNISFEPLGIWPFRKIPLDHRWNIFREADTFFEQFYFIGIIQSVDIAAAG